MKTHNERTQIDTSLETMVLIPAGEFIMGAEATGWGDSEYPAHHVFISQFLMDEHHVTNSQFRKFVEETDYQTTAEIKGSAYGYQNGKIKHLAGLCWQSYASADRDKHPVVLVSWSDANAYCQWAGKRLPSEAEWEYATRGGKMGMPYPWGEDEPSADNCNMAQSIIDIPPTSQIKTYPPNGFGLYDVAGNVWDLCADFFDANYYHYSPFEDPKGPTDGELICRRGASFNIIQPFRCRNANRGAFPMDGFAINVGFRCAKTL